MTAPFSNATEGDAFIGNRCCRCVRYDFKLDLPCDDFTPAYFGDWPAILHRVPTSRANPLGVECRRFEAAAS